jgi:hypothetical protein
MSESPLSRVTTLAFDIFGTVLDLTGSITPPTRAFLKQKGATVSAETFWDQWRSRQRIEQYQDSLMELGHSGYLETCRRMASPSRTRRCARSCRRGRRSRRTPT